MLARLALKISDVDITAAVAANHHDFHSGHMRRSRVSPVRRGRDKADGAMKVAARAMIGADRKEARVFALSTRIRLKRNGVVACYRAQHRIELGDQLVVTFHLRPWSKRMRTGKLWPCHRNHFCSGIELHRA